MMFPNNLCVVLLTLAFYSAEISAKRQGKIIGGNIANIEQAPYNVAVEYLTRQICGGAVLRPRWVVTAAHCFGVIFLKSQALVRAGSGTRLHGGREHDVRDILKHPNFDIHSEDNDIALIEVSPPLVYSAAVSPIRLPDYFIRPRVGELVTAYGWGYTSESGYPSEHLRAVQLPIFSHDECRNLYRTTLNVTSHMLCAGYPSGGRDACVLDSGGPLVWQGALYGLVSWGLGCARPLRPGVFTDVNDPSIKNWILNNMQ